MMVRLSRRLSHDQKRPRRSAAPKSLQDPLLSQHFWHDLVHEYEDGGETADNEQEYKNDYDDEDEIFDDDDEQEQQQQQQQQQQQAEPAPVFEPPMLRRRSQSQRVSHTHPTTQVSNSMMVVLEIPPERLRRIRRGLRQRTPRASNKQRGVEEQIQAPVEEVIEEIEDSDEEPYRGVLAGKDADTINTMPTDEDEKLFDAALRNVRRESPAGSLETSQTTHQNVSNIRMIHIGGYEIDTWYTAPYPEEYSKHSVLPLCEFCLKYMSSDYVAWRHRLKCPYKHPPGNEIYRHGSNSIFEVDGKRMPLYCQNLCLLAKMFLDSKTLYYDVEPFMFYVLTENDKYGCHFVGYFSKQKVSNNNKDAYNVSCILTLPTAQRKGYGNFLIDFSYLLSRKEGTTGTPEKPLSNLGLASYTNYWKLALCYELRNNISQHMTVSVAALAKNTGMTVDDVVVGLEQLKFLAFDQDAQEYALKIDARVIDDTIANWESKDYMKLCPENLVWSPLLGGEYTAPVAEDTSFKPTINPDPDAVDKLEIMVPPLEKLAVTAGYTPGKRKAPSQRNSSVLKKKRRSTGAARSSSNRSRKSTGFNPDGTPTRPRGRPKGAVAIPKLAQQLGVSLSEAAKIRERDKVLYKQHNIHSYTTA